MSQELEPIVRIRDLKKDRVNFVLENVDMAYAKPHNSIHYNSHELALNQSRKLYTTCYDGRHTNNRCAPTCIAN